MMQHLKYSTALATCVVAILATSGVQAQEEPAWEAQQRLNERIEQFSREQAANPGSVPAVQPVDQTGHSTSTTSTTTTTTRQQAPGRERTDQARQQQQAEQAAQAQRQADQAAQQQRDGRNRGDWNRDDNNRDDNRDRGDWNRADNNRGDNRDRGDWNRDDNRDRGDWNRGDNRQANQRPQYRNDYRGNRERADRDRNWSRWRDTYRVRSYRDWDYDRSSRPWFDYGRGSYFSIFAPSYSINRSYPGYGSRSYRPVVCSRNVVGGMAGGYQRTRYSGTYGGAIVGPLLPGYLGNEVDLREQACIGQVLEYMPNYQAVYWEDNWGTQFRVTPSRTYKTGRNTYCRNYDASVYYYGQEMRVRGTACRTQYGTWVMS